MPDRDDALSLTVSVTVHVLALSLIPSPQMQTGTPERGTLAISVAASDTGQPGAAPNPSLEPAAPRQSGAAAASQPAETKTPDTDRLADFPATAEPQAPADKKPAPEKSRKTAAQPPAARMPEPERPSASPAETASSEALGDETPKRAPLPEKKAALREARTPVSHKPPEISETALPKNPGQEPPDAAALESAATETLDEKPRPMGTAALPDRTGPGDPGHKPGRRGTVPVPERPQPTRRPEVLARPLYHLIPNPPYPKRSRDLGEEGRVIIAVLVAEDGNVAEAYVHKSSGHPLLDGSALATVREKWLFKPARSGDTPVTAWVRVPINFRISER